jgi:hypothetical protein
MANDGVANKGPLQAAVARQRDLKTQLSGAEAKLEGDEADVTAAERKVGWRAAVPFAAPRDKTVLGIARAQAAADLNVVDALKVRLSAAELKLVEEASGTNDGEVGRLRQQIGTLHSLSKKLDTVQTSLVKYQQNLSGDASLSNNAHGDSSVARSAAISAAAAFNASAQSSGYTLRLDTQHIDNLSFEVKEARASLDAALAGNQAALVARAEKVADE